MTQALAGAVLHAGVKVRGWSVPPTGIEPLPQCEAGVADDLLYVFACENRPELVTNEPSLHRAAEVALELVEQSLVPCRGRDFENLAPLGIALLAGHLARPPVPRPSLEETYGVTARAPQ